MEEISEYSREIIWSEDTSAKKERLNVSLLEYMLFKVLHQFCLKLIKNEKSFKIVSLLRSHLRSLRNFQVL